MGATCIAGLNRLFALGFMLLIASPAGSQQRHDSKPQAEILGPFKSLLSFPCSAEAFSYIDNGRAFTRIGMRFDSPNKARVEKAIVQILWSSKSWRLEAVHSVPFAGTANLTHTKVYAMQGPAGKETLEVGTLTNNHQLHVNYIKPLTQEQAKHFLAGHKTATRSNPAAIRIK